jgi:hypothetical protein
MRLNPPLRDHALREKVSARRAAILHALETGETLNRTGQAARFGVDCIGDDIEWLRAQGHKIFRVEFTGRTALARRVAYSLTDFDTLGTF